LARQREMLVFSKDSILGKGDNGAAENGEVLVMKGKVLPG